MERADSDSEALSSSYAATTNASQRRQLEPSQLPMDSGAQQTQTCMIHTLGIEVLCSIILSATADSIEESHADDDFIVLMRRVLPLRCVSVVFKLALDHGLDSKRLQLYNQKIDSHFQAGEQRVQKLIERCMMICFMPNLGVLLKDDKRFQMHKQEWTYLTANFPRRLLARLKRHKQLQTHADQENTSDLRGMFVKMVGEPLCNALAHAMVQTAHNRCDQIKLVRWACENALFETRHKRTLLEVTRRHVWLQEALAAAMNVQLGTLPAQLLPQFADLQSTPSPTDKHANSTERRRRRALPISFGISPVIRRPGPDTGESRTLL